MRVPSAVHSDPMDEGWCRLTEDPCVLAKLGLIRLTIARNGDLRVVSLGSRQEATRVTRARVEGSSLLERDAHAT